MKHTRNDLNALALTIFVLTSLATSTLFANKSNNIDQEIIIQENDINVTTHEAHTMINEMTWEQKQKVLKNPEKFKSLLFDLLELKKQEQVAIEKEIHKKYSYLWKLKIAKANLLSKELVVDFQKNILIPDSINSIAKDKYYSSPEKYIVDEKVSVAHILLKFSKDASKEQKQATYDKSIKIINEIKGGLDFKEAAKKYSDDSNSHKGGVINYFKRGRMVAPFEQAAFTMKDIGEISKTPVETQFGFHIIKLLGRIEAGTISFEEAKHELIRAEKNKYIKQKTTDFLQTFHTNKNTSIFIKPFNKLLEEEKAKLANPFDKTNL